MKKVIWPGGLIVSYLELILTDKETILIFLLALGLFNQRKLMWSVMGIFSHCYVLNGPHFQ